MQYFKLIVPLILLVNISYASSFYCYTKETTSYQVTDYGILQQLFFQFRHLTNSEQETLYLLYFKEEKTKDEFFKRILKTDYRSFASFWRRKVFAGHSNAPLVIEDQNDKEALSLIKLAKRVLACSDTKLTTLENFVEYEVK